MSVGYFSRQYGARARYFTGDYYYFSFNEILPLPPFYFVIAALIDI